jgi:hypothetical protein
VDPRDILYLGLLTLSAVVFVYQRRQLRRADEAHRRLVAEHGQELAGMRVELDATREELQARVGEVRVTETMTALVAAVGTHLERAMARVSFDAPEVRARVAVYQKPHLPQIVATAGTAARWQLGVAQLAALDPDPGFQARVARAAEAAGALVEAVRYAPPA